MTRLLFQQKIILGIVARQDQDLFQKQAVGLCGAFQPGSILAAGGQVFGKYLTIQHKGDGGLCPLYPCPKVGEGGRFLFRAQSHRETAVGLHDRIGDIPGVEHIFAAQRLHQIGGSQPQGAQGVLIDLTIQDDGFGPPGHQVEKALAPEAEDRPKKLQRRNEKEGDQAGCDRYFFRFNGDGSQIGDEDGGYQFLRLQFPQLTFAHQPHGKQDAEIDQDGTEDQEFQTGTPPSV